MGKSGVGFAGVGREVPGCRLTKNGVRFQGSRLTKHGARFQGSRFQGRKNLSKIFERLDSKREADMASRGANERVVW